MAGAGICDIRWNFSYIDCLAIWPCANLHLKNNAQTIAHYVSSDHCAPWPTIVAFEAASRNLPRQFFSVFGDEMRYEAVEDVDCVLTHPVAYIRCYFEFNDLRLQDYYVNYRPL